MKCIFVDSRKFDYGQDLIYAGLAAVLGKENIHDLPRNSSYHLKLKAYPKNLGYSSGSPLAFMKSQNVTVKNCDVVFVGCLKPDALKKYIELQPQIPSSTPIVLIDGGDAEAIGADAYRLNVGELWEQVQKKRPFDFIFKREYMKGKEYAKNIFPLPFSINFDALAVKPATHFDKDVSFWAVESHPIRTHALELLKGQFDCDRNGTAKNQVFKNYKYKGRRYHEELAKCKIVLSFRGGGWDTLRYWEVPSLGPLLVSQKMQIVIPNDFEDKKHVVYCKDDLTDLLDLCRHYLKHDDERKKITSAALEHAKKYHTHIARAQYVLETLKQHGVNFSI
jgi:Glycosyl transferases group 1